MTGWLRRPRTVLAVLAAVACCVSVAGAAARPSGSDERHGTRAVAVADDARERAVAAAGRRLGLPPLGKLDQTTFNGVDELPHDAVLRGTTATVQRAKVSVTLPVTTTLGYVAVCLDIKIAPGLFIQTCCPGGKGTCPDEFYVDHPTTSYDDTDPGDTSNGVQWTLTRAKLWPVSPSSSRLAYGTFPPIRVRLLAFGSVPVTATAHLTQRVGRNGYVDPLRFEWLNASGMPSGTSIGGFPVAQPDSDSQFNQYMRLAGSLDLRLSNVRVDGVATNVGSNCRTARPATVSYGGPAGWYRVDTDPDDLAGRPGEFAPLNTTEGQGTGEANASITVPAFRGCRDGARSLDKLVTALASGPRNALTVRLAEPLFDCSQPARTRPCPPYPGDGRAAAADRTASAQVPAQVPAQVARRLAAHRADLVRAARGLDPRGRAALLGVLPAALAGSVARSLR